MTVQLSDIEDEIGETGLNREQVLDFVRLLPSSDVRVVKPMIEAWSGQMRDAGVEVDEKFITRVLADFEEHGRLLPTTIEGLPAHRNATLERPKIMEDSDR